MNHPLAPPSQQHSLTAERTAARAPRWLVLLTAALIFFGCLVSPPSLMDDVDAAQASIARTMLTSGDWVTPRLNGVAYLEKPPLKFWLIALSFRLFGDHDWAARIPIALAAVLLCWLSLHIAHWGLGPDAGWVAGLCLATCVGLFLFTRILIADVLLTLTVTAAVYALFRALEDAPPRPLLWPLLAGLAIGAGILLKGLLGVVLPLGALLLYLAASRQLFSLSSWKRLNPLAVAVAATAVAGFWHVAAILRHPPYFDLTLQAQPFQYRGFFWFYFINEHLLRFLGTRYPQDYNTVPRLSFLLLHLVWLFPWSAWLLRVPSLEFGLASRPARLRLLALCWSAFVLLFFSFSTTQEYYSMPAYPAFALLLASAIVHGRGNPRIPARALATICSLGVLAAGFLLYRVQGVPTPGDISLSLAVSADPQTYTLSLGHLGDLTFRSFAYLRGPLALAAVALLAGALACWRYAGTRALWGLAIMMVLLAHSARLAMVKFDPFLSSRALAEELLHVPPGPLVVDDQYYAFSSVFYYANRQALLLNGRVNNLEYGSYAPGAPPIFIDDVQFARLWNQSERLYLLASRQGRDRLAALLGPDRFFVCKESGGKLLLTNLPLARAAGAPPSTDRSSPGAAP